MTLLQARTTITKIANDQSTIYIDSQEAKQFLFLRPKCFLDNFFFGEKNIN